MGFSLRVGRSTSSFGTWYCHSVTLLKPILTSCSCAAMNGVPTEIVQRAENLILLTMRGEDLVAACCQMSEDEAAELEEAVRRYSVIILLSNLSTGANREGFPGGRHIYRSKIHFGGHTDDICNHRLLNSTLITLWKFSASSILAFSLDHGQPLLESEIFIAP